MRALRRPHVQRRRNTRLDPDTQVQTFPNRRLQTEVSSLMARRPPGTMLHILRRGGCQPPAGRTLCAPTSPFLSRARAPAGRSADMGAATTLSRCGGCATRGCPYPFCPCGTFPPDRGNRPCGSEHNHSGFWPSLVSVPHSGPSALLRTPPRFSLSRCGSRAAGSLSLRLGLVSGPPRGPALALAPLQAPLRAASALLSYRRFSSSAFCASYPGLPSSAYILFL